MAEIEIEVFRARNTTGLAINETRVTKTKPYGLIQTIQKFKVDDEEVIKALGIDVQLVVHGRWKYYKNNGIIDTYICTNCQGKVEMAIDVEPSSFKYCPNCGARMDGDAE